MANDNPRPRREPTLLGKVIGRTVGAFAAVVLGLFLSICLEWIGMAYIWPQEGVEHSHHMLVSEINYLNQDLHDSIITSSPARFAAGFADRVYGWTVQSWGMDRVIGKMRNSCLQLSNAERQGAAISGQPLTLRLSCGLWKYAVAAITMTQVYAVRLAVAVLALPAFLLIGVAAATDGLMMRDLRRWGGGRESSYVYAWAKRFLFPSLLTPVIVYLAIPVSVRPAMVFMPFLLIFGGAVMVWTKSFKKYL